MFFRRDPFLEFVVGATHESTLAHVGREFLHQHFFRDFCIGILCYALAFFLLEEILVNGRVEIGELVKTFRVFVYDDVVHFAVVVEQMVD